MPNWVQSRSNRRSLATESSESLFRTQRSWFPAQKKTLAKRGRSSRSMASTSSQELPMSPANTSTSEVYSLALRPRIHALFSLLSVWMSESAQIRTTCLGCSRHSAGG